MFRKIEYQRVLETSMIQEKELNEDYGVYGWQLVSVRTLDVDIEYIFSRKQPLVFYVLIDGIGKNKIFTQRAISFHWCFEYLPKIGERFNPMDFLDKQEKDFINRMEEIQGWLTPAGKEMFESRDLKEETLCDFLHRNIQSSVIKSLQMSHSEIQGKYDVFMWLADEK